MGRAARGGRGWRIGCGGGAAPLLCAMARTGPGSGAGHDTAKGRRARRAGAQAMRLGAGEWREVGAGGGSAAEGARRPYSAPWPGPRSGPWHGEGTPCATGRRAGCAPGRRGVARSERGRWKATGWGAWRPRSASRAWRDPHLGGTSAGRERIRRCRSSALQWGVAPTPAASGQRPQSPPIAIATGARQTASGPPVVKKTRVSHTAQPHTQPHAHARRAGLPTHHATKPTTPAATPTQPTRRTTHPLRNPCTATHPTHPPHQPSPHIT